MAKEIVSGIYKIENTVNGKCYIGSAVKLKTRIGNHRSALKHNRHPNQKIQRAWNKYGEGSFVFVCVEFVDALDGLIGREQHWIDSLAPEYNIAPVAGSSLGRVASVETRKKQSEATRGRKIPEERRLKMVGRKFSDEAKEKISTALKGKLKNKPWSAARREAHKSRIGKRHTPETIEKMRIVQSGKIISPETRKKISDAQKYRKPASKETREKLSIAGRRPCSDETKAKISLAHSGTTKGPMSMECKLKISMALIGKKKMHKTYNPPQVATPAVEPKGRAPAGEAFQK